MVPKHDEINRRTFLAGSAAAFGGQTSNGPAAQPNILHIMTDQQQWGTIVERSDCRTPNLNQLARSGLTFERSYTPSAVCCPARAMILSGSYHWHNGVYNQVHSPPSVHRDMNPDVVLYSNRLHEIGYRQGYIGKWHASNIRGPKEFGFDEVADLDFAGLNKLKKVNTNPDNVELPKERPRFISDRMMRWPGSEPFVMWGHREGEEETTPEYYRAECAIRMMRRFAAAKTPWHIEVHFVQPHDPYMPLTKYLSRYDPKSIPIPKSFYDSFEGKPGLHRRESETWGEVNEADYQAARAHYYAYVEQVDVQIGRILKGLDETGQANNTIVVFTTDHGDMVGAHRMWIKGWIPYEETYRVPLIVRWPGYVKPESRSSNLVATHYLANTYIDAAGAKPLPFATDGRALQPLFKEPDRTDWPDQLLCAYYGGEFLYTQRMVVTKRFKYVFNGFDIDECYDLKEDPEEMHNIVSDPKYRTDVDDLRARLYELMNQTGDPFGDRPYGSARGDRYCAPRYLLRGKRLVRT